VRVEEEEEEEEEGKWKEDSKGHLFLARDSQMQSEKHSSFQNLEQQPKAHKSLTFFGFFGTKLKTIQKGQVESKLFYVRKIEIRDQNTKCKRVPEAAKQF